jgi:hypothetical protein
MNQNIARTITAAAATGALVLTGAGAANAGTHDNRGSSSDRPNHGRDHRHGDHDADSGDRSWDHRPGGPRGVIVKIDGLDRDDTRFVAKLAKKAADGGKVTAGEKTDVIEAIEDRTEDEVKTLKIKVKHHGGHRMVMVFGALS